MSSRRRRGSCDALSRANSRTSRAIVPSGQWARYWAISKAMSVGLRPLHHDAVRRILPHHARDARAQQPANRSKEIVLGRGRAGHLGQHPLDILAPQLRYRFVAVLAAWCASGMNLTCRNSLTTATSGHQTWPSLSRSQPVLNRGSIFDRTHPRSARCNQRPSWQVEDAR